LKLAIARVVETELGLAHLLSQPGGRLPNPALLGTEPFDDSLENPLILFDFVLKPQVGLTLVCRRGSEQQIEQLQRSHRAGKMVVEIGGEYACAH
jgi:hypothetical protein